MKQQLESEEEGLSEACGCYVFALRAGGGFTPYYGAGQGMQVAYRFRISVSNLEKYNGACQKHGTPCLFCASASHSWWKLRNALSGRYTRKLISWSAGSSHWRYKRIQNWINNKETFFLRTIHVPGLLNPDLGNQQRVLRYSRKYYIKAGKSSKPEILAPIRAAVSPATDHQCLGSSGRIVMANLAICREYDGLA